jgi:SAM-dependent methyltransferase
MYPFPEFVFPGTLTFFADVNLPDNSVAGLGRSGAFCQADVQYLPFADQAFDFVHCSNVLEHIPNPERGYRELRRIAAHGYIECPSAFRENIICHTGAHRWIVELTEHGVTKREPTQTQVLGLQVLPMTWIYRALTRIRICWKIFDFMMADCLGLMYRHIAF